MVSVVTPRELRRVRDLPFCYLCGLRFVEGDTVDHDHVPPKSAFAVEDRLPLKLKTHKKCNGAHSGTDEEVGQLLSMRRRAYPSPQNRRLNVSVAPTMDRAAVSNLNVHQAVIRWIQGFHAALYREPMAADTKFAMASPFPKLDLQDGVWVEAPCCHSTKSSLKRSRLVG